MWKPHWPRPLIGVLQKQIGSDCATPTKNSLDYIWLADSNLKKYGIAKLYKSLARNGRLLGENVNIYKFVTNNLKLLHTTPNPLPAVLPPPGTPVNHKGHTKLDPKGQKVLTWRWKTSHFNSSHWFVAIHMLQGQLKREERTTKNTKAITVKTAANGRL